MNAGTVARRMALAALVAAACARRDDSAPAKSAAEVGTTASAPGSVVAAPAPPAPVDTARRTSRRRRVERPGDVGPAAAACVVRDVSDGDTMRCRDGRKIRLLQIDAPESDQRPFGTESRNALAGLAPPGTRLRVELDRRPTDRYGRTLAFLYLPDGRMLNEEMVRRGYAVPLFYSPNYRHENAIRAAADSARIARRGLHAIGGFTCEPRAHRRGAC